jgi:hypothetical protein
MVGIGLGCWSESPSKNRLISGLISVPIGGLSFLIGSGLLFGSESLLQTYTDVVFGLSMLALLLGGGISGCASWAIAGFGIFSLNHIYLVETIHWEWRQLNQFRKKKITNPSNILMVSASLLLYLGLTLITGSSVWLRFGLMMTLTIGLVYCVLGGMIDRVKVSKESPNNGITLSRKNASAAFLVTCLIFGLTCGLTAGLWIGLCIGLFVGLVLGQIEGAQP